jgi:predicted nucleic-acid-binding Zn-ribbon protein
VNDIRLIDTYTVDSSCSNCGYQGMHRMPKGHRRPERKQECPRCKCSDLIILPRKKDWSFDVS